MKGKALVTVLCVTALAVVCTSALAKKGHVTVTVYNTTGKPVGEVPVYLRPAGSLEGFTNASRTNNSGQARFPNRHDRKPLDPNRLYEVWVFCDGEWYRGEDFMTDGDGGAQGQTVTVGGVPSPPPWPPK